jgi:hypothetical protein
MTYFASLPLPADAAVSTRCGIGTLVPAVLGSVLLTAAALKAHQLAFGSMAESSLFTSRWSLIGLIELELALGLCLLLGLYPRQTRLAALACFTAFGAVSLQQALAGRASCSCFGAVDVRPWYTFLFDVAAVVALGQWHTNGTFVQLRGGVRNNCSHSRRSLIFSLCFVPASVLAAEAGLHPAVPRLAVSPAMIDLGAVPAGGSQEATFTITNPGITPLTVARVESSCPCLKIELPDGPIEPGGTAAGRARLDMRAEPGFSGDLGIEVKGLDESGAVLFIIEVNAEGLRG